jgi:hypothetical protein
MATERQIQANRRNAALSTGPQSPQGKAISAANALTHGFSARNAVLPSESSEDYQALLDQFEDEFQPQSALEQSLLRQLADSDWRLRRAACFESAVLLQRVERARRFTDKYPDELPDDPALSEICLLGYALIDDADGSDPLSKLSRHEARLTRRYFKALAQLLKARRAHQTSRAQPPRPTAAPAPSAPALSDAATLSAAPTQATASNPAHPNEPAPAANAASQPQPPTAQSPRRAKKYKN